MEIIENQKIFDQKQEEFTEELVRSIKHVLVEYGLKEQAVYDLTDTLVFNVAALIDGSSTGGEVDNPAVSYLAFRESEDNYNSIVISPVGSYIHEIAVGFVEDAFE